MRPIVTLRTTGRRAWGSLSLPPKSLPNIALRSDDGPRTAVLATVLVERSSQKGILIGKGGSMLRQIGSGARLQMQKLIDGPVHLDILGHLVVDELLLGLPQRLVRLLGEVLGEVGPHHGHAEIGHHRHHMQGGTEAATQGQRRGQGLLPGGLFIEVHRQQDLLVHGSLPLSWPPERPWCHGGGAA